GTARASYVGCPTNTLPTGWSPNDFVCGAATLYNSNSNVKINEQGICFGSTCKTAWPSSSRPSSVTKYDWQGRTANGGSDNPDQGNTASHDLCFLTKVYSHDDEYNSRLQGCKIEPQGTVGSGPIPWKKNVLGDGGLSYCSAVCINW
ncbi:MAG: hypothetical protein Q7S56_04150, partial [Nanoarchaeota archaeon]|nr:hypothetical protein [Nanoarchaeota archaeon]